VNEQVLIVAACVLSCLPLTLALAASGLPLASAALLFSPPKRVKVFRDKFGQQTATFCLLAGMVSLASLAAAAAFLQVKQPAAASFWLGWPLPLAPMAGGTILSMILAGLYRGLWQNMRDNRPVHAAIGLAATLSGWGLGYLLLSFLRHFVVSSVEASADPSLFLPPSDSGAWFLAAAIPALSLSLAGSLGSLYLIRRRDKDDFGRDYYNYALKLACRWSLVPLLPALGALGVLLAQVWPVVRNLPARPFFFWSVAGAAAAYLMAFLLWALVIKNQNPLRLKLHCIMGYVLSWLGLSGLLCAFATYYFG